MIAIGVSSPLQAESPPGFDENRHLRVDQVKPGMRGYGVTVFQGATTEPFEVEVVSVQEGFEPGKAVVWVRCPDERMQQSGPVQGMSGSPIYLWTDPPAEGETHTIGEGGRIIGAFAFGHSFGKDCFVGVQPIEQMLEAGARAKGGEPNDAQQAAGVRQLTLEGSHYLSQKLNAKDYQDWRLHAISDLTDFEPRNTVKGLRGDIEALSQSGGQGVLPLMVGSSEHADLLAPFFTPMGLFPTASPRGMASGNGAPPWIQSDQVEIKPGSVLAIPLAFGPMELSAMGTATDVLPDGTVLGFGHSMFAQGDIAVPMATGFVHFVQPNVQISFKLGGSLDVKGAIVRDEAAAVIGKPGGTFRTVPATVNFNWPGGDLSRKYEYEIVHHPRLLPGLVASVAMQSMQADVELPRFNTVRIQGAIAFENGKTINIDQLVPNASGGLVASAILPAIGTLIDTDYGSVNVESIDLDINIEDSVKVAEIAAVTLERANLRPGETITANIRLVPFREDAIDTKLEIVVPDDLPDGQYQLMIGGAQAYQQHLSQRKPHLMVAQSQDELFDAVQQILSLRDDALYGVLTLPPNANDLALGRTEHPELPSSRRALLSVDSSTRATPYVEGIEQIDAKPFVVSGGIMMPITVQRDASTRR